MSYAVSRAEPSSSSDPPTTATVFDYICLFTHDLKRKQKRWQDGRLKYHTFNRRVMVYDDRGNFIGDAHWPPGCDLAEGEELHLDRGSAIVQVADRTGQREQDLTEMLDKRAKEVEKRRAAAARTPARVTAGPTQTPFQLLHKPLASLVASPGAIGRAVVPGHSPYEARKAELRGNDRAAPSAKRRKRSASPPGKAGYAQNLFGATISLTGGPMSSAPLARGRALRDTTNVRPKQTVHAPQSPSQGDEELEAAIDARPKQTAYVFTSATVGDENVPGTTKVQARQSASGRRSLAEDDTDAEVVLVESRPRPPPRLESRAASGTEKEAWPQEVTMIPSTPPGKHGRSMSSTGGGARTTDKGKRETLRGPDDTPPRLERSTTERPTGGQRDRGLAPAGKRARSDVSGVSVGPNTAAPTQPSSGNDPASASKTASTTGADAGTRPDGVDGSAKEVQPRTELRIKARRKKGLLVISEKKQSSEVGRDHPVNGDGGRRDSSGVGTASMKASDDETCHGQQAPNRREDCHDEHQASHSLRRTTKDRDGRGHSADVDASESKHRVVSPERPRPPDMDDPSADDDSDVPQLRRTKTNKKNQEPADDSPANKPGPVIKRMPRKSIKSKEIFGFQVPGAETPIPLSMASATGRVGVASSRATATAAEQTILDASEMQPAAGAKHHDGDAAPRLANPASRGRKAARKEDAAGSVPSVVVPLDPPLAKARDRALGATGADGEKARLYPGFESARGGTWSKHAEDLLGMSRPEKAKAR